MNGSKNIFRFKKTFSASTSIKRHLAHGKYKIHTCLNIWFNINDNKNIMNILFILIFLYINRHFPSQLNNVHQYSCFHTSDPWSASKPNRPFWTEKILLDFKHQLSLSFKKDCDMSMLCYKFKKLKAFLSLNYQLGFTCHSPKAAVEYSLSILRDKLEIKRKICSEP